MQLRYCPQCNTAIPENSRYCNLCGSPISTLESAPRYLMSVNRVILLSVISAGLYIFYWYYITWKQYRDHTRENAYPIWHSLTLFVPFYNLFRTHAHMRTYMELMLRRDLTTSISPGIAVAAIFVSFFLDNIGFRLSFGEITEGVAITILVTGIASTVITAWLLVSVQGNINRYWLSVSSLATSARPGIGEVIFAAIGILIWIDSVVTVTSESYRTGF